MIFQLTASGSLQTLSGEFRMAMPVWWKGTDLGGSGSGAPECFRIPTGAMEDRQN
jgi:hypothetical protein